MSFPKRLYILGYAPVMDAEVVADVDKPDFTTQSIILLDNGAGKLIHERYICSS